VDLEDQHVQAVPDAQPGPDAEAAPGEHVHRLVPGDAGQLADQDAELGDDQ
jgi:hypothetical protein